MHLLYLGALRQLTIKSHLSDDQRYHNQLISDYLNKVPLKEYIRNVNNEELSNKYWNELEHLYQAVRDFNIADATRTTTTASSDASPTLIGHSQYPQRLFTALGNPNHDEAGFQSGNSYK